MTPISLQTRTRQPTQAPELPSENNRMLQVEYDNFRDALYETSLKPNNLVSMFNVDIMTATKNYSIAIKCILYIW